MLRSLKTTLLDANKWAQEADGAAIALAFREIGVNLTRLLFALTYLLIVLGDLLVGQVESLVKRGRGAVDDRRETKLKTHLDWDKDPEANRPTGALRR